MKKLLKISGVSRDKKPLVSGVYMFCATYGVPLDILVDFFKNANKSIDWIDYFTIGKLEGADMHNLRTKAEIAVSDIYGLEILELFRDNLDYLNIGRS